MNRDSETYMGVKITYHLTMGGLVVAQAVGFFNGLGVDREEAGRKVKRQICRVKCDVYTKED
jgi:hypothetical protein